MELTTKITTGASILLLIATIVLSAGLSGQKNVYACVDTNSAMICDSLSKINLNGISTRCYYINKNVSTYKHCNTGWLKYVSNEVITISKENVTDYICNDSSFIKECINKEGKTILRIKSN